MSEEFEIKKISQETLGEYLSSIRQNLGLSVPEVAKNTEILEKFILAIEEGRYQILPPDAYVLGFLKKLAKEYNISCEDIVEQFKKEKGIVEHTARGIITPQKGLRATLSNISVTPKLVSVVFVMVFVLGAFSYIAVQVFSVNRTPSLTVIEPSPNTVLSGSSVVFKGQTEPGISVTVNDQNVMVDADGKFTTTVGVAPGQKDFRLIATNKFGKTRVENLSLRVDEPMVAGEVTELPSELVLEIEFTKAATISITRDGENLPEEDVRAGSVKKITALEQIDLTTSDAGNTNVILNGEELGALGRVGQSITVPFTKEGQSLLDS
ncbi:MAG TPA: DUF4115 domain-containing protein [Candidatus Doudnabacteria bacterium]|nr:DUF4115 domain-containing protein [Candidatus Doudnabacteria bacterium]